MKKNREMPACTQLDLKHSDLDRLCPKISHVHCYHLWRQLKGYFTYEPKAATMKLWEPKRKCPKAFPIEFQNHVVWSRTLKCSVKPYVTGPSTKCYFNECLFMWGPHTWQSRTRKRQNCEALSSLMKDYNCRCPLCSCQSMTIYYTYNQTILGFCTPSSQMQVKD